jgi:hypothetical protein
VGDDQNVDLGLRPHGRCRWARVQERELADQLSVGNLGDHLTVDQDLRGTRLDHVGLVADVVLGDEVLPWLDGDLVGGSGQQVERGIVRVREHRHGLDAGGLGVSHGGHRDSNVRCPHDVDGSVAGQESKVPRPRASGLSSHHLPSTVMTRRDVTAAEASDLTAIPVLETGRAWMMDPGGAERANELGLDGFFGLWVIGRVGAMCTDSGEVTADVAAAGIGFMSPDRVRHFWESRPAGLSSRAAAEQLAHHAAEWGRRALAEVDDADLARCAELAHRVTSAALPTLGALFAGWRSIEVPDDPAGAVIIELQVLRELRGGAHLSAVNVVGLGPHGAILSFDADPVRGGPKGAERFGWSAPHPDSDPERRVQAEALTTAACVPAFEALSGAERAEFVELVQRVRGAISL